MTERELARPQLKPLSEVLGRFIGHDRSHDVIVTSRRCPYCRRKASSLTEVFVAATRKWSTHKICTKCSRRVQARADAWLAANTAPIHCNDPSLAARVWKRIGRKSTAILVVDFGVPEAGA